MNLIWFSIWCLAGSNGSARPPPLYADIRALEEGRSAPLPLAALIHHPRSPPPPPPPPTAPAAAAVGDWCLAAAFSNAADRLATTAVELNEGVARLRAEFGREDEDDFGTVAGDDDDEDDFASARE